MSSLAKMAPRMVEALPPPPVGQHNAEVAAATMAMIKELLLKFLARQTYTWELVS
jgi:hypothetical protein